MKQEFSEPITKRSKVLAFQLHFIKGEKTIKEISHLTDVKDNYVRQILSDSMLISVDASEREQTNNLMLLELMKEITKVKEIIAPNYLHPIRVGDMVVGDYK